MDRFAASFLSLASLASLGCSSVVSTSPSDAFPVGTYTRCAEGARAVSPGWSESGAGFLSDDAVLTVERSGSTLTATYVDENGKTSTFDFARTTSTSATLTSTGETVSGFSGSCTEGPGDSWLYPALMSTTAGALTYDEGTVFVALEGTILPGGMGSCGGGPAPGSFWLVCDDLQGGAPSPEPAPAPPPATQLSPGPYPCASLIAMYDAVGATTDDAVSGGEGTLALTQTGAEVTVAYSGDPSVAGTLHLTSTTSTTAIAAADQTLTAPCTVPFSTVTGAGPSPTPVTLPISAGSLALVGSTLFVSFAGTMDASSSCPGALMAASLICSKP